MVAACLFEVAYAPEVGSLVVVGNYQLQGVFCACCEFYVIDEYLKKYRITNKSNWMRETLLSFIYKNLDEDYPTLFGEHDMRR